MCKLGLSRTTVDSLRLVGVLVVLMAAFGLSTDRFFTAQTWQVVANQLPTLLTASIGMTFVLLVGGIDLSVGSVLALGGGVLGVTMVGAGWPLPVAVLGCVATGVVVGVVNGAVMIRWRLPSFIVTLGMLEIARGAAYLVTRSQTQYIGGRIEALAEPIVMGLTGPFFFSIALVVIAQAALSRTVFGRHVVAIGTNEEAVRLAGIDTRKVKLCVFALSGALAGAAAVMHAARLGAADPNAGAGFELSAIAAAVVGGTSLMGGRGSIVGSLFGVLIIAVLDTGLAQVGAQEPSKRLITGAVIIAAVIVDNRRRRGRALSSAAVS